MKYLPFLVLSLQLMSCQSNWKNEVIADITALEQRMVETQLTGDYRAQLEPPGLAFFPTYQDRFFARERPWEIDFSNPDSIIFMSWDLETPVSRLTEE